MVEAFLNLWSLSSLFDYLIVGAGLYVLLTTLRGTRIAQFIIALLILIIFQKLCVRYNLTTTLKVLNFIFNNLIIFVLIVYQEEIRHMVNRFNQRFNFIKRKGEKFNYHQIINNAVQRLSEEKVGSLIILQGEMDFEDHVSGGTTLNAEISEELLLTIFENKSALHDGAVVIKGEKIQSAAVVLPLTKNSDLHFRLGTRHRAAIGITEEFDCLAIVVSEETGTVRIAQKGEVMAVNEEELKYKIHSFFKTREDAPSPWQHKIMHKIRRKK